MGPPDQALSRVIDRVDQARAHGERLAIRGGGTKDFYGGPVVGEPLELGGLAGVSSYEPTELVVTARAGTPLAELESVLTERGQCLPFEPPRFAPGGTVGGMVAAGLAGPARAYAGSVRDHVLGVTMLDGNSELLTFGGQVAKNVAGYDVSRVMAGSLGILGVICEVSLKVLPAPRSMTTVVLELDERGALERLAAWASKPLGLSCPCARPARRAPSMRRPRSSAARASTRPRPRLGGPACGTTGTPSSAATPRRRARPCHFGGCPCPRSRPRCRCRASNGSSGTARCGGGVRRPRRMRCVRPRRRPAGTQR
jgi:FAD/FMN-containing dehydrogenase